MNYLAFIMDNNSYIYLFLIIVIFILAKNLQRDNYIKKRPKTTKFNYKLFYADEKKDDENIISAKILKSDKYKLKGKPDYILKHKKLNKYIPIELKSGMIKDKMYPRENDLMQLVAYFLIIEDLFDNKPKYGYLVYKDYMFIVKNTKKLRQQLLQIIKDMKFMETTGKSKKISEVNFPKCRLCKYRSSVCQLHKK